MTTTEHAIVSPSRSLSPEERRKTPRVAMAVGVGFQSDTNFYTGFTEDLSEGGLFVATYAVEAIGSELALTFTLPNGQEITAVGVVRWVRDPYDMQSEVMPGMGVQFRDLAEADLAAIREFIAVREPMFYVS